MPPARKPWARWVLAITIPLAMFIGLTSWAIASPVGGSPDDDYHMASIWCAQGTRPGLCTPGDSAITRMVPDLLTTPCYAFHSEKSAACIKAIPNKMVLTNRGNFDGSAYPPLYYLTLSVFASTHITTSIFAMRIFNAALFVSLATVLFFLLRRSGRGPLAWGTMGAFVPLGVFLIPSVNPSGWAVTSASILWISLVGFFSEPAKGRRIGLAVLALVASVIGAGARSDAAVYSGLAALVAVILCFERTRRFALSSLFALALIMIDIGFFFSGGQSGVINPSTSTASWPTIVRLFETNLPLIPELWAGALGTWGLGWIDTPMRGIVWVLTIGIFMGLTLWGLRRVDWRRWVAQPLMLLSLIGVPLYVLVHDQVIVGQGVQPRYIYPLMIMMLGVSLYGLRRDDLGMNTFQLGFIVAALSVANAAALQTNLRRYVTGNGVVGFNLDHNIQWWWNLPFGPMLVWIIGSVSFAIALAGLVIYAIRSGGPPGADPLVVIGPSHRGMPKNDNTLIHRNLTATGRLELLRSKHRHGPQNPALKKT